MPLAKTRRVTRELERMAPSGRDLPAPSEQNLNLMKLSPSIDLIWRLAANEMAAGQFKEIEPEHFCMALLKFAELPSAAIEADEEHAEIAKTIAAEAELVREAVQKCGIESTPARRQLRGQLGKGGTPHQDGEIHRSAASRALFEAAAFVAESGGDTLTPLHLLTALVQSPTPAIEKAVLGKAPHPTAPPALLLLEEHGKDLVKEASEGRLRANSTAEASGKALIQILLQKERKSILLITDQDDLAEKVAIAIACSIAGKKPAPGLKGRRLIDIAASSRLNAPKGMAPSLAEAAAELERLRRLLAEAASHQEIILLVPPVEVESKSLARDQWASLLRETLLEGNVQFICRVAPKMFTEHLRKDAVWKRQTEAVWLEKAAVGSIPREL